MIKAKKNLEILKSSTDKNFDVIKKEVDLSIRQLEEMPKDSNAQMNKFVERYNLDI
jgi:hypothetical protein